MKSIAIMQPYFLPYLGYFQLLSACDTFIFLDDVNYIKRGYINRNRILINNDEYLFTLPVEKSSQYKKINQLQLHQPEIYIRKISKQIRFAYKQAPFYKEVYPFFDDILKPFSDLLCDFVSGTVMDVAAELGICCEFKHASSYYLDGNIDKDMRIYNLCKRQKGQCYINPIGGVDLYCPQKFSDLGLDLYFLKMNQIQYPQFNKSFIANLSIIDVLMFNGWKKCRKLLRDYQLIKGESHDSVLCA